MGVLKLGAKTMNPWEPHPARPLDLGGVADGHRRPSAARDLDPAELAPSEEAEVPGVRRPEGVLGVFGAGEGARHRGIERTHVEEMLLSFALRGEG